MKAAYECGLTQDDGKQSVIKTINSGKRAGMEFSRCIPCSSEVPFLTTTYFIQTKHLLLFLNNKSRQPVGTILYCPLFC